MKAYARAHAVRDPSRERLIAEHMEMARRIALRVARRTPSWLSDEDLLAAAMVGLAEAAERYDEGRGEPFVAFAEKRIRGAVLDELRRGDVLPRRARWAARKVSETIRGLEQSLHRSPEDEEIAKALGVSVVEYRENLEMLTQVGFVELGTESQMGDAALSHEPSALSALEREQAAHRLRTCLGRLAERDSLILSLYYVEEFNYAEIGRVLDVSESRVCQLHARALVRLRAEFEDERTPAERAAVAPLRPTAAAQRVRSATNG